METIKLCGRVLDIAGTACQRPAVWVIEGASPEHHVVSCQECLGARVERTWLERRGKLVIRPLKVVVERWAQASVGAAPIQAPAP